MRRIRYVPGPIGAAPNFHTLPAYAPDIDAVVSADITRISSSFVLGHGDSGVAVPHADGVDVGHAGLAVDLHADHAHDLVSVGTTIPPVVPLGYTFPPAPPTQLEDDGAPGANTLAGGLATGIQDFLGATIPHGVAQPNDHPAADIALSLIHDPADIAAALIDHANSGVTPLVAVATVLRRTARTFTLNVATLDGDMLTLAYHEVGSRVLVS